LAEAVVGIADGDTLTVRCEAQADQPAQTLKVRLAEIDAPEKGQAFGNRSKQHLSDVCFKKQAEVRPQTTGRYGRTVARVICDGTDQIQERAALLLAHVAPEDDVDVAGLVLERHEDHALGSLALLALGDDTAGPDRGTVLCLRQLFGALAAAARLHLARCLICNNISNEPGIRSAPVALDTHASGVDERSAPQGFAHLMAATYKSGKAASLVAALSVLGACQTVPEAPAAGEYVWPRSRKEMRKDPNARSVAYISAADCEQYQLGRCGDGFRITVIAIDGARISTRSVGERFIELLPGNHTVHVAVRWSNGTVSVTPFHLDVEGGREYVAYAYEVNSVSELALANPWRRPMPTGAGSSNAGLLAFHTLSLILAPFVLVAFPVVLSVEDSKRSALLQTPLDKSAALPFAGCCWSWIQDQYTNVVAGEKVHARARQEDAQPNGKGGNP